MTDGHPHWRRNLTAVTIATFIGFTGFTLVMPFLPLYLEQLGLHEPGAIAVWSGVSLGITPAITALMAPYWARLADRHGRKLMVTRSLVSFVVIMGAMAFVTAPWQVFGLRAIQGFFAGYGAIALTMAAESAPETHMARAIGWVQTAQRLGPALGPVLGGALAGIVGLRWAFIGASAMFLGASVLVVVGYRESEARRIDSRPQEHTPVTYRTLSALPLFGTAMVVIFCLQMVDRSFGPVLPLYLRDIGVPTNDVAVLAGLIFTVAAGAGALGNQVCDRLMRVMAPAQLVLTSVATSGLAALLFASGPSAYVLLVAAACFGAGLGVAMTAMYTLAGQQTPADQRGIAFGYLTRASLTGLALSPVASGLLGSFTMRGVFVADAIGLGVVAWLLRGRLR